MNVYPNMLGSTKSGNTYTPAAGIRLDRGYEYDLMGSVVKERDRTPASAASQGPGSIERVFGHDPLRRLLSATGRESTVALVQPSWDLNVRPQDYTATNTYTRSYTYDRLGNIQTLRHVANGIPANNFTRRYNYQNGFGSNMLETMGIGASTYPYTYDASGNQTKENTDRYFEWNYSDKLSFYKRQAGSSSPTVWSHYFYDASGQRIKKVVNKPDGIQEMTVYVDGVFEHSYVRINNNVDNNRNYNTLHILDASRRIATLRVGKDSQDSTPELKYYVEDHLGNSSVSVQSNGNRINLEEYYPFGETSFGGFQYKRYRYNGKEKDEHTGLYEYGARYYAPWLCRFISVDPIAEDYPHLSSYNYASNRPVTARDLEGLQAEGEKHDERKRNDGKNIKDGVRTSEDTKYEIHNLPTNPKDGQQANYYYTKGNTRQAQWTYSSESNAWGSSEGNFAELRDENIKSASTFSVPAKNDSSSKSTDIDSSADKGNEPPKAKDLGTSSEPSGGIGATIEEANDYVTPITLITSVAEDTFVDAGNARTSKVSGGKSVLYVNKLKLGKDLFSDNKLMRVGRMNTNWSKSIGGALKAINKVAIPLSIASTLTSITADGKLSAGDAVKGGLLVIGLAIPAVGLGLGAADLIGQQLFDTSLTDVISNFADSSFSGTLDISNDINRLKKLFSW